VALGDGKINFQVTGGAGSSYVIESSTNLVNWTPLQTNVAPFAFGWTTTANASGEFFRAASLP
jgi:hypothetical protein